jgi:hypothetical protein
MQEIETLVSVGCFHQLSSCLDLSVFKNPFFKTESQSNGLVFLF